jgi:hypothetical protein
MGFIFKTILWKNLQLQHLLYSELRGLALPKRDVLEIPALQQSALAVVLACLPKPRRRQA